VRELDWWDEVRVASLAVTATPTQHFSGRALTDRNRTLWCGFACSGGARRLYFAGDSGYCPAFAEIERRCGPFDVALMPVGAYEPRWFMRPVHMDPEESVQACLDLGAALAGTAFVPMHWGTFRLTDEPVLEPPARARAAWHSVGMPEERFWQLAHGETRAL
jgi:L-ascorbate metabolism protein UlaG (beta-lactamase superfamily)